MKLIKIIATLACLLGVATGLQAAATCNASIAASTPSAEFTDNGNGTVTHNRTGLMWKRCAEGQTWSAGTCSGSANSATWASALQSAVSATTGGYRDWRLPNIKELQSIVEEKCVTPSINESIFPNTPASSFWSASAYASYSDGAWGVYFGVGYANGSLKYDGLQVRLVRAGQSFGTFDGQVEQTPPIRNDWPVDSTAITPANKAIVMTHGWNSDANAWPVEMANDLCSNGKIGVLVSTISTAISANKPTLMCQVKAPNNDVWDVWVLDWRMKADTGLAFPNVAYWQAKSVGEYLAKEMSGKYSHIHLIAHSAGANVIHTATPRLQAAGAQIHATYLDAFDPSALVHPTINSRHVSSYGLGAQWVDNYVDTRPLGINISGSGVLNADATDLHLPNGYNVDVTPDTDGCDGYEFADAITCRHGRPMRFYGQSIDKQFSDLLRDSINGLGATGATGTKGFPMSLEGGGNLSLLQKIKDAECRMQADGTCNSVAKTTFGAWVYVPGVAIDKAVDTITGSINYVIGTGATLYNVLKFGVDVATSVLASSSIQMQSQAGFSTKMLALTSSAAVAEPPSLITTQVTTSAPVNTLRFNWQIAAAGEGFLRVFVDGNLVREIDQRHVPLASTSVEEVYVGGADGNLPAGAHRIAIRLDGFGTSASGVELTNVELGAVSVQPAADTLNLAPGWNLLGNSLSTALPVSPTLSDTAVVTTVWKWDAANTGWQFYAPSMDATTLQTYATSKGYGVLSSINPGEGYWVNAKVAATLANQTGTAFSLGAANLLPGWNLVATGHDVTPSAFNLSLSATPPATGVIPLNLTTLWAWDTSAAQWYFYAPGLEANGGLGAYTTGKGYLDFSAAGKTLGNGIGFWVNKP